MEDVIDLFGEADLRMPSGWAVVDLAERGRERRMDMSLKIQTLAETLKPVWMELPGALNGRRPGERYCTAALADLAAFAAEGPECWLLEQIKDPKCWNTEKLAAAGKKRPTLWLETEVNNRGNMIVRVRRKADEWKSWPDCAAGPYMRPGNELAFIRGAAFAFDDWAKEGDGSAKSKPEQLANRTIGYLVWATVDACRERVSRNFDVEFVTKVEPSGWQPLNEPTGLKLVSRFELEARRDAEKALLAPYEAAKALVRKAGGRTGARQVTKFLRLIKLGEGAPDSAALACEALVRCDKGFAGGDVAARVKELTAALDLVSPHWKAAGVTQSEQRDFERLRSFAAARTSAGGLGKAPDETDLYRPTAEELAAARTASALGLLATTNKLLVERGGYELGQVQWPTSRRKFIALAKLRDRLEVPAIAESRER